MVTAGDDDRRAEGTRPEGVAVASSPGHSGHPGPTSIAVDLQLRRAMVEEARSAYPNEACGIVVGSGSAASGGQALRFVPTRNAAASPFRYEIDPGELLRISLEADDRDEFVWGIFHSHTHTAARPSPTDVGLAFYPDSLYVLVSLDPAESDPESGEPGLRAWRIVDGRVWEVTIEPPAELRAEPAAERTAEPSAAEERGTPEAASSAPGAGLPPGDSTPPG